nr:autotransporter outer membrane beta-barrel domain-containing protein [Gellertiella hungarica]
MIWEFPVRSSRCRGRSVAKALLPGLALLATPALGAGTSFTARLGNDWSNGLNWSGGRAPSLADTAVIDRLPQVWLGARPGAAGSLYLGVTRSASLYAGTALSLGQARIGQAAGSSGRLQLSGLSARLVATGSLVAGIAGTGEIDHYRAASLRASSLTLGSLRGARGTLLLSSQSTLTLGGGLVLGQQGTGVLDISTAARATVSGLTLGSAAGGSGIASISGGGTRLASGQLVVGGSGSGRMTVSTGAAVTAAQVRIGAGAGGSGRLDLSNGGTSLGVSGATVIGAGGTGSASLYTGARLSTGSLTLGAAAGASGSLVAGSGSTALSVAGDTIVGASGRGSVTLQDGATARSGRLVLGAAPTGTGSALLSGSGSRWIASLPVEIGRAGRGALTLTGGASLSAGTIDIARDAGSSGTLSIGAVHGALARGAGSLDAATIRFGAGSGALVFNHGGPDFVLASRIGGRGTILVDAGPVVLTGDSSGFGGTTRITGGSLAVEGALGGTVAVSRYGTLAGTGTVGSVDVGDGGRLAPAGPAAGELAIAGDLSVGQGGHLQVSVSPALDRTDRLTVGGSTRISSGAVLDVLQDSAITLDRRDVILTSGGGLTGRFDTVTSNYAFVTPELDYGERELVLSLRRNDIRFASAAPAANAARVAEIGDRLDPASPLYAQLLPLSKEQAGLTFGDMAATIHASPALNAFDMGRFARTAALERAALPERETATGAVGWARAYGGYSTRAEEGGDRIGASGGLLFGWDGPAGEASRFGLLGGIGSGSVRESDGLARSDSRDHLLGLYGQTEAGDMALRFGATYVHQDIDSRRSVRFSGFTEHLDGAYRADALQAYGEIGRSFGLGDTEVEPFANLALAWQRTGAFAETGGHAAVSVSSAESLQAETVLGLRATHRFDLSGQPARMRAMLGWNHAFEASGTGPEFAFAGSAPFSLEGAETAGDSAVLQAGLDVLADDGRLALGLTYDGAFSAGAASHMVKLTLSRQF